MKNKIFGVFMFAAGAAIGSIVTWKYLEMKYDALIQEEIDSVKEAFGRLNGVEEPTEEDNSEAEDKNETPSTVKSISDLKKPVEEPDEDPQDHMQRLYEYESEVARLKYASATNQEEGGGESLYLAPYVISPDDYGEEGYEVSMLTYYSDGVLEDEYWNVIDNPDDVVGSDFVGHFDEYVDDTVYVRNEELKTDYEITRDKRTYAESQAASPYGVNKDA